MQLNTSDFAIAFEAKVKISGLYHYLDTANGLADATRLQLIDYLRRVQHYVLDGKFDRALELSDMVMDELKARRCPEADVFICLELAPRVDAR